MTTTEKLARLKNYHTRYELIASNGTQTVLLAYTSRKSRQGLVSAIRQDSRRSDVAKLIGGENTIFHVGKCAADGFTAGAWTIRFSGRTQRDAILLGEHEYVSDFVASK